MDDYWQQEAEAGASHRAPAAASLSVSSSPSSSPSSCDSPGLTLTHGATTKEEDDGQEEEAPPPNPRFLPGGAHHATSKMKKERKKKLATACAICFRNKVKCDGNFPCARCYRLNKPCRPAGTDLSQIDNVAKPYRRRLLSHVPLHTYIHGAQREGDEGGEIEGSSLSLLDLVIKRVDSRSMAEASMCAFTQLQATEGDIFDRIRVIEHVKFWRDFSLLLDGADPTHGLCSVMAKAFNIHPQELESVYDLTHARPRHVKKAQAQERLKQRLAKQKEEVAWIKDTDVYKYANDGTRALLIAYVDEGGLVIATNEVYDSICRSSEELVNDIFEQRTLVMYLMASVVAPEDRESFFLAELQVIFAKAGRRISEIYKLYDREGTIRLFLVQGRPVMLAPGRYGCLVTYEPAPASRYLTTRTDTIRPLSSHHPPTTHAHTHTHTSAVESGCLRGCVGMCVCGEVWPLGKEMAEGEGGGGGEGGEGQGGDIDVHAYRGTHTDTQTYSLIGAQKRRGEQERNEAFHLSSVKDCEGRDDKSVRMPCGHQLLPLTIVPLPLPGEEIERIRSSFSEVIKEKGENLFDVQGRKKKKRLVEGGGGGRREGRKEDGGGEGDEEREQREGAEQVEGSPSGRDKRRGKGRGSARGRGGVEEMSTSRPSSPPAALLASSPSPASSIFDVRPSSSVPLLPSDLPRVPTMDSELMKSIFDD